MMLPWHSINTVLLDMDGTLLDLSFDNYFWLEHLPVRYAQCKNTSVEDSREYLENLSASLQGSLQWYCLDHWSEELGLDLEEMKKEVQHRITLRPHVPEFILWLKEIGKEVKLVTNAHPKVLALKAEQSKLHLHIEQFISSHEFSLAKENNGFWLKLAAREGIDLESSLLLDDSLPVLNQAADDGVGYNVQMLHPDSAQPIQEKSHFPGIVHFTELM